MPLSLALSVINMAAIKVHIKWLAQKCRIIAFGLVANIPDIKKFRSDIQISVCHVNNNQNLLFQMCLLYIAGY